MVNEFVVDGMMANDAVGYMNEMVGNTSQITKIDELMSSWYFVGGVTAGILLVGVLLGLLSAKRKIKKGIDLYED